MAKWQRMVCAQMTLHLWEPYPSLAVAVTPGPACLHRTCHIKVRAEELSDFSVGEELSADLYAHIPSLLLVKFNKVQAVIL
ncbi:hypothetical protein BDZ97DRAFT_1921041 [Flammula alnicola]|nr:hypothetical protein BDZ97DRAFT_1921041 [Flammula alnicola]